MFENTVRAVDCGGEAMRHEQAIDGTPIWYEPVHHGGVAYAGTINGSAWELGGHTWVVHLRGMSAEYERSGAGRRGTVMAAALHCLSIRRV